MNEQRTQQSGSWRVPAYRPGDDEMWDKLGSGWSAIDGVRDGIRLYVQWDDERPAVTGLCLTGAVTAEALRSIPMGRLENLPAALQQAKTSDEFFAELVPLRRVKGEEPDEFADRVALYYRMFAATTDKPTKAIAEHADVPLGTVRSWIREARLRGKLPPGTRGKAG
ncbi:hypothetical protein [Actinomadura chokoriensis]|uniref:Uncharacterized protein n=1 Tax=Actinomadura chokoriensis TaxID=454156 RepID=A0ABV4R450_9ACTN